DASNMAPARRGAASGYFILILPILAGAFMLTVNFGSSANRQTELLLSVEAAALAGANAEASKELLDANTLFHDILLTDNPNRQTLVLADAGAAALRSARLNPVGGEMLELDPNTTNDPAGEIVLGTLDGPTDPNLMTSLTAPDLYNPHFNAVTVRAGR